MAIDVSEDYYAILGVGTDATAADLRRAWRQLAIRWHPDRAGVSATFIFQKILTAYSVLSSAGSRAEYDRRRGLTRPAATPTPTPAPPPPPASSPVVPIRRRAPTVLLQRLSGPLSGLVACGAARRIEGNLIELLLTVDEALQGGMVSISMQVPVVCRACAGRGQAPCRRCGTARTVSELYSAWLAVPPEVADGTLLTPSALLPGMVRPVAFRVRVRAAA